MLRIRHAYHLQQLADTLLYFLLRQLKVPPQAKGYILAYAQKIEQSGILKNYAHMLAQAIPFILGEGAYLLTVDNNAAGSRWQQSCQQLDNRAFACTGRADNRQRFTLTYIQIKIIKNYLAAEGHFKLSELNHSFV